MQIKPKLIFFIIFLAIGSVSILADSKNKREDRFSDLANQIKKNRKKIEKTYWSYHKKFSRELCRAGTEEKFWKNFRSFRGDGHYLPRTVEGKLDRKTLNRYIPELVTKGEWIESQQKILKKKKNFKKELQKLEELEKDVEKLVLYKEEYLESKDDSKRATLKHKSKYLFISFKNKFLSFLKEVPFLTSYRYPVDHFELRENYDQVKHSNEPKDKIRANEVYFYRKVVQDGAQDPNHTRSDRFLRAMLDTLSLKMKKNPSFISETIRYDLYSALDGLGRQLKRGPTRQLTRFKEWEARVVDMVSYYNTLKSKKLKDSDELTQGDAIVEQKEKARSDLKKFVYKKHSDTYNFWATKDEIYRALYTMTTILFNEVGSIDGRHALERMDVLHVVLNRVESEKYNFIPNTDELYPYLKESPVKSSIDKYAWLNVLFKEGEFSFTYYFIHGAVRSFCADMTRAGRRLRSRNLDLAMDILLNRNKNFKGMRYFSRASMLGRISMDDIWQNYEPLSEKAGVKLGQKMSISLLKKYKAGDYTYRYHFTDDLNRHFKVVKIDDTVYSLNTEDFSFFTYRNPHYFRYFSPTETK